MSRLVTEAAKRGGQLTSVVKALDHHYMSNDRPNGNCGRETHLGRT